MQRLQELVRLWQLDTNVCERARMFKMSSKTEGMYRGILAAAGLLEGDPTDLPDLAVLRGAVAAKVPSAAPREVVYTACKVTHPNV